MNCIMCVHLFLDEFILRCKTVMSSRLYMLPLLYAPMLLISYNYFKLEVVLDMRCDL